MLIRIDEIFNHEVTPLDILGIQMLSLLSTFSHGQLSLELSDLFLQPGDNDAGVHSLVPCHLILNH